MQPGAPADDVAKQAQVDGEYAELKDAISDYAGLAKRMKERSALIEVAIAPRTQPGVEDVALAMAVYADLNDKLAPMCGESARACIRQFSVYETCKKGNLQAECGVAPSCETTCALTETGFKSLGATVCRTAKDKGSMLIPDWSKAGEKLRAQQMANREKNPFPSPIAVPTSAQAPALDTVATGLKLDFMGKPLNPTAGCTVEGGYATAMMMASMAGSLLPTGSSFGGSLSSRTLLATSVPIANNILSRVEPVYPALAKAAHISGTVMLHVMITKAGEVTVLSVVSGPALLQAAAVEAVKQWRYKPFSLNGVVHEVDTVISINFNFGGEPGAAK